MVRQAGEGQEDGQQQPSTSAERTDDDALPLPSLGGLWSFTNSLSKTVQARAQELVKTVAETDWRSEITSFTKEVENDAAALGHTTVHIVGELPQQLQHLPQQVRGRDARGLLHRCIAPLPSVAHRGSLASRPARRWCYERIATAAFCRGLTPSRAASGCVCAAAAGGSSSAQHSGHNGSRQQPSRTPGGIAGGS